MERAAAGSTSLADKLDRLFRSKHSPRQREHTYDEIAAGIREQGGPTISSTYLWELRTGREANPRKQHLEALAKFFGVSPAYFFDDETAARTHAELELLAAMQDADIRGIATRATGLSTESLRAIGQIIERVRALEGLPGDGQLGARPFPHQSRATRPEDGAYGSGNLADNAATRPDGHVAAAETGEGATSALRGDAARPRHPRPLR